MHVLQQPIVIDLVLQYAGPDQWLFLGAVSKAWAALHTSVALPRLARKPSLTLEASVVHSRTTSFNEATCSLARAMYACDCDATLKTDKLLLLSRAAASYGRSHVLIWAQAVDSLRWLEWHQQLCMAAAAGNQLATLQELRTSNAEQQWEVAKVAAKAAERADLPMLQWVVRQQPGWTKESIETVGAGAAGSADAIDKITWLCQRFPATAWHIHYHFALASIKCGTVESLQWLASFAFELQYAHFATTAAAAGQLAVLRYLVEQMCCPWEVTKVREAAVMSDSAETLEWASSANVADWTIAQLSEQLVVAGQNDKLRAAKWLRAAGAEWPTSFLYQGPEFPCFGMWSMRAMQWARANGCPWGAWNHTLCSLMCRLSFHSERMDLEPIQDAMLWAHAASCPCSNQQHCIAGTLIRNSNTSNGNRRGDVNGDRYGDLDTGSKWSTKLFKDVFVDCGEVHVQSALTMQLVLPLVVLAASVVILAVALQF
eukprot:14112-Heterococcus_DN1.PRE.2